MCHNFAGSGGALTRGKYAPNLRDVTGAHIYEAMVTGPQSMPVFNDANITPENKRDIIAYLHDVDKTQNPGGLNLGNLGPVSEGLFVWIFGLGAPHRLRRLARQEGRVTMSDPPRTRRATAPLRNDRIPHTMTDNGNSQQPGSDAAAPATTAVALSRSTRDTSKAPAASRSTSTNPGLPAHVHREADLRPRRPPRRRSARSR